VIRASLNLSSEPKIMRTIRLSRRWWKVMTAASRACKFIEHDVKDVDHFA